MSPCFRVFRFTCESLTHPAIMWVVSVRLVQVWGSSGLHWKWVLSGVVGQFFCGTILVPVWHRWHRSCFFQTICRLWPTCVHCCPWTNVPSPSDVSWLQMLGLRSWLSCVVPFAYGGVVLFSQHTNLSCINYITLFTSGCFDLRVDKFLPQCCWIVSEQECVFMKILLNLPDTPASPLDERRNIFKELRQVHFSCSVRFLTSMIKWHLVCHMLYRPHIWKLLSYIQSIIALYEIKGLKFLPLFGGFLAPDSRWLQVWL